MTDKDTFIGKSTNKVLVRLWLESGCSQDEGEVTVEWKPINFMIYSELFPGMIYEAVDDWLSENRIEVETEHELILRHTWDDPETEYFETIHHEVST